MMNDFRETVLFSTVSVTRNNNNVFVHLPTLTHCCISLNIYLFFKFYYHTDTDFIVSVDYNNYRDIPCTKKWYDIMNCPHIYYFVPTTSSLFKLFSKYYRFQRTILHFFSSNIIL